MIRIVLVDDEPLARNAIRVRLADDPTLEVVGEAGDGPEAIETITSLRPDLIFLDVQMPEMDGFEVLERIAPHHLPVVVFVTAFDRFAVRAFEANALDYLLKPFGRDRFEVAVRRARAELARADPEDPDRIAVLLERRPAVAHEAAADARPAALKRFVVKELDRYLLLPVAEVEWIESCGNYAQLHARGRTYLVRETMKDLEVRLEPGRFARVHRSAIVNIDRVREIRPEAQGDFEVALESGARVRMSRNYRDRLLAP